MGMGGIGRFAGDALKRLGNGIWDIRPRSIGSAALDFGPDILFAGMAGATAPSGWQAQVGAEDFGINLGASMIGRLAGRSIGKRLPGAKGLTGAELEHFLAGPTDLGSMLISAPLTMLSPRPVFEAMLTDQKAGQDEQQHARDEEIARIAREQLLNSVLMGTGATLETMNANRPQSQAILGSIF